MKFFATRCGSDAKRIVAAAQSDPSIIDGLSYPITLLFALRRLGYGHEALMNLFRGRSNDDECNSKIKFTLNIIVLGATTKAEQRLLYDTNYWAEVGHFYPKASVRMFFVGPEAETQDTVDGSKIVPSGDEKKAAPKGEVAARGGNKKKGNKKKNKKKNKPKKNKARNQPKHPHIAANMECTCFKGTALQFLRKFPALAEQTQPRSKRMGMFDRHCVTVCVGFNPGFGSGSADLIASWINDLVHIAKVGIPCVFSQSNDYSDLLGEIAVLRHIVNAKYVLPPVRNPFSMATTAQQAGREVCQNTLKY